MLMGLQADHAKATQALRCQQLLQTNGAKIFRTFGAQVLQVAERELFLARKEIAQVAAALAGSQLSQESIGKTGLHSSEGAPPRVGNPDRPAFGLQWLEHALKHFEQAWRSLLRLQNTPGLEAEAGESQQALLHGAALVFVEHHDHGDANEHLRHRPQEMTDITEDSFHYRVVLTREQ